MRELLQKQEIQDVIKFIVLYSFKNDPTVKKNEEIQIALNELLELQNTVRNAFL